MGTGFLDTLFFKNVVYLSKKKKKENDYRMNTSTSPPQSAS